MPLVLNKPVRLNSGLYVTVIDIQQDFMGEPVRPFQNMLLSTGVADAGFTGERHKIGLMAVRALDEGETLFGVTAEDKPFDDFLLVFLDLFRVTAVVGRPVVPE